MSDISANCDLTKIDLYIERFCKYVLRNISFISESIESMNNAMNIIFNILIFVYSINLNISEY